MPQRLLLEGSDIDELLQRVQAEHGPQATIVHAEQKLVGGVAGFFARRRYELSVQVDDPPEPAVPTAPGAPPATFEDLLARADGADGADDSAHASKAPEMTGAVRTRPVEMSAEGSVERSVDPRTSAPTAAGTVPTQRGRRLSTQSPAFEDLLSTLVGRAEGRPTGTVATSPGDGPPALLRASGTAATGDRTTSAWERVVIGVRREPTVPAEPTTAAEPRTHAVATLLGLGLPADRLPTHVADDPRTALLDVLAQLPAAPARRLWGTTVVVGPADLAHRAVDALVEHTGGTGESPLVTDSTAPSSADVAVRASALCASHGSAVVVIETPATRAAARRAGRLLAGLGLGTVIAAIDATRDGAATREWLVELGAAGRGPDQLAAFDVAESPTPLALLGLGPDVGWLDGRAATVGVWAAPCLDRHLAGVEEQRSGR